MTLTNSTTKAILAYLNSNRWVAWRQNNIASKNRTFTGKRGVPDVIGFSRSSPVRIPNKLDVLGGGGMDGGKFIGIEIKTDKDKLSIYQLEFAKELTAANGAYFCVKSFDDFKIQYEAWLRAPVTFNFQQLISLKQK